MFMYRGKLTKETQAGAAPWNLKSVQTSKAFQQTYHGRLRVHAMLGMSRWITGVNLVTTVGWMQPLVGKELAAFQDIVGYGKKPNLIYIFSPCQGNKCT